MLSIKMKNYFLITFIAIFTFNVRANCPEFETSLEAAMRRVREAPTAAAAKDSSVPKLSWQSTEAQNYKAKYGEESVTGSGNREYIKMMEADSKVLNQQNVVYFDVENAVQKKLNDSLIGDKLMVDAVNNSFMEKFVKNLKASPDVMAHLKGQYKDYKSLRLRLIVKDSKEQTMIEAQLDEIYKKTNQQFTTEFERNGLTKLLPPRTDEVPDVSTWFLSGTGESALEANMAARGARGVGFSKGNATTVSFKQQVENMYGDVTAIEGIRKNLARETALLKNGILTTSIDGTVIPSKEMIAILRKIKPSDCENAVEYATKIRTKVKNIFKDDISDKNIDKLTMYFQKVDSISPPLFQRERVIINLGEAKAGIISVDFTGVGVDNAFEQMRALAAVHYAQKDKGMLLKDAFQKVQGNVDGVTDDINNAKRTFTLASAHPGNENIGPKFSGDDGILIPKKKWGDDQKSNLIKELSATEDPSKYRVTFVKTEFSNGAIVPAAERSQRIVRAETIEKEVREKVVGAGKISSEKAKKIIIAIDSAPAQHGGQFNLILGGAKLTEVEKKLILDAFKRTLSVKDGEISAGLIEVLN
jgi:hypothetical protein